MGASQSNDTNKNTLQWDNLNTDSYSCNLPNISNMNNETKELIDKLQLTDTINYEETESENSNIFAWLKDTENSELDQVSDLINMQSKNTKKSNINNEDYNSATSPFISSEEYDNLVNEKTSESSINDIGTNHLNQNGGYNNTSSTSIGSITRLSRKETIDSDDSNLSYLSSSAHTEGSDMIDSSVNDYDSSDAKYINSESKSCRSSSSDKIESNEESIEESIEEPIEESIEESKMNQSSEYAESTISNGNNNMLTSEIATSDIDMISSD